MKSKAIFMFKFEGNAANVYDEEVKKALSEKLDFAEPLEDINDIEKRKDDLKDVEYIFSTWGMLPLSAEQIKMYLPKVKAVFYAAGTVQYFARPFIENGIDVFSAWAANAVPVAEFTVAQMILASKGYFQTAIQGRAGQTTWANIRVDAEFPGNYGNRIGIIGVGMIGSLVAEMLKSYKVEVWGFDPFMSEEKAQKLGIKKVDDVHEIFKNCLVISNHLANNDNTAGMLDKSCFDLMQKNAIFINTGRGRQVVADDLVEALKAEPLRVALLDVTYPDEPPCEGSVLYTMPNIFLSPHIAGSNGNEIHRMAWYMYDEFINYTEGKPVRYKVTAKMLETMA